MVVSPLRTMAGSLHVARAGQMCLLVLEKHQDRPKNLQTYNRPATGQDLDTEQVKQRFC